MRKGTRWVIYATDFHILYSWCGISISIMLCNVLSIVFASPAQNYKNEWSFYAPNISALLFNKVNLVWKEIQSLLCSSLKLKEQILFAQSEHKHIRSAACREDGLTVKINNSPLFPKNNCLHWFVLKEETRDKIMFSGVKSLFCIYRF